jgi:hypothetical protein
MLKPHITQFFKGIAKRELPSVLSSICIAYS